MNVRDLINELEQLEHDYGDDCEVKLYLSIEGQLIDDFEVTYYGDQEIHINSSERKIKF